MDNINNLEMQLKESFEKAYQEKDLNKKSMLYSDVSFESDSLQMLIDRVMHPTHYDEDGYYIRRSERINK
jgi:hypothetical protein